MTHAKKSTTVAIIVSMILVISMTPTLAFGKSINSEMRAESMAKAKVGKKAFVKDVEVDYKHGELYYEVELIKGNKEYDLKYKAKNSSLVEYQWELKRTWDQKRHGRNLSMSKLKSKALRTVKGGTIISYKWERDDGLSIYEISLKKNSKKYTLELNAKSGSILKYKWKTVSANGANSSQYIGQTKAKSIAKNRFPGATVKKCEFDIDDGIPNYEVDMIKRGYVYEITIHARTGKILDVDIESLYDYYDD